MKWFQHDSSASTDAKIKKLLLRHGPEGYAVYFHCIELVAGNLDRGNINFEIEHDAEIIADNLKFKDDQLMSGTQKVTHIMKTIVELGLFQADENHRVFIYKLAQRLDNTMSRHPEIVGIKTDLAPFIGMIEEKKHQYIYIIKGKDQYKIGKTSNWERRSRSFKTTIPFQIDLKLLMRVDDMKIAEKAVHDSYTKIRTRGEWFKLEESMINDICVYLSKHFNGDNVTHIYKNVDVQSGNVDVQSRLKQTKLEQNRIEQNRTDDITPIIAEIADKYSVSLSDQEVIEISVRLKKVGLSVGFVKFVFVYVSRQKNIKSVKGYFKKAFFEYENLVEQYKKLEEPRASPGKIKRLEVCPGCGSTEIIATYNNDREAACHECKQFFEYLDGAWVASGENVATSDDCKVMNFSIAK